MLNNVLMNWTNGSVNVMVDTDGMPKSPYVLVSKGCHVNATFAMEAGQTGSCTTSQVPLSEQLSIYQILDPATLGGNVDE